MTSMPPTASTVSRALPVLLAAGVVAIVLGIVGMHGLSPHGVMSDTDHAAMTATMPDSMTGPMSGSHTDPAEVAEAVVAAAPDGGNGHDMGGMVMLCVSMLAAAAVTLLLLLALIRRTPRPLTVARPAVAARATRWVTARLGTGPPPVWEFSVVRC